MDAEHGTGRGMKPVWSASVNPFSAKALERCTDGELLALVRDLQQPGDQRVLQLVRDELARRQNGRTW
jgi:hypothetical protein